MFGFMGKVSIGINIGIIFLSMISIIKSWQVCRFEVIRGIGIRVIYGGIFLGGNILHIFRRFIWRGSCIHIWCARIIYISGSFGLSVFFC